MRTVSVPVEASIGSAEKVIRTPAVIGWDGADQESTRRRTAGPTVIAFSILSKLRRARPLPIALGPFGGEPTQRLSFLAYFYHYHVLERFATKNCGLVRQSNSLETLNGCTRHADLDYGSGAALPLRRPTLELALPDGEAFAQRIRGPVHHLGVLRLTEAGRGRKSSTDTCHGNWCGEANGRVRGRVDHHMYVWPGVLLM
jgi:hypothetical protein